MKQTLFFRIFFLSVLLLLSLHSFAITVSGKVFHDKNKNGEAEAGESGIPSVYIRLFYRTSFQQWRTMLTQTTGNGSYVFEAELQTWEIGLNFTVLELGTTSGPAVGSGVNPVDFNHNDPNIPGGFNGTTTLRRLKGPYVVPIRSPSYDFGHANFKPFSPTLPNALVVGSEGSTLSPSSVYGIDLSTGATTQLLDSVSNPIKDPILGLGYNKKTNTFMGCASKYEFPTPRPSLFVVIENTSPITITKLPKGENVWFYSLANHAVDISPDGFMVDFAAGSGYFGQLIDVRPTSVNFLQRVNFASKKFDPTSQPFVAWDFGVNSDVAFNPRDGLMYEITAYQNAGDPKLQRKSTYLAEPAAELARVHFDPPIDTWNYLLNYCDNNNQLFVVSDGNEGPSMLYRIDLTTRRVIQSTPLNFSTTVIISDGASNPKATVPIQNAALRYGLAEHETDALKTAVLIKPNPVPEKIVNVSLESGIESVELLTTSGQRLLQKKVGGLKDIDVALPTNTKPGNYLIRIVGNDGKVVTKSILVE